MASADTPFGNNGLPGRTDEVRHGCFIPAVDLRFGFSVDPNGDAAETALLDFPFGTPVAEWDGTPNGCGDGHVWMGSVGNLAVVGGSWLCAAPAYVNGRFFIQNDERQKAVAIADGALTDVALMDEGACPFGGLVAFMHLGTDAGAPATWACYEPAPSAWRWDFRATPEGWNASQSSVTRHVAGLGLVSSSNDPWITSPAVRIDTALKTIRVRMKVTAGNGASIYFMRDGEGASEERVVLVPISPGAEPADVVFDMGAHPLWTGVVTRLRFDFTNAQGAADIDFIAVEP